MGWFAIGFRIGATALIAVAVIAAGVPAPGTAATEDPGLEQLWEQFPLDDRRDASRSGGATPGLGANEEPLRPLEQEAPKAGGAEAAPITTTQLALLAAAVVLMLGMASLAHVRFARRRRRNSALRVGPPARVAAVEPLAQLTSVDAPRPRPTAPPVTTSRGSTESRQLVADLAQWLSPVVAPDAPVRSPSLVQDASRNASATPEPLTVAPTNEEGGHVSEIDVLKAKLGANSSKPNVRADAEVELLKRKPATAADAVKTKAAKAPIRNERLGPEETFALKEKLTDMNAASAPVLEALADDRPLERDTPRGAHMVAVRGERRFVSGLRDLNDIIWKVGFGLAGAVTGGVLALLAVSLVY